ncbi:rho guanine nucleotide exchange factor 17 [Pelomyxa schiedti]|nr:rho guanine nucleotide exchange factor 17 [Pelomyxa schiedti]
MSGGGCVDEDELPKAMQEKYDSNAEVEISVREWMCNLLGNHPRLCCSCCKCSIPQTEGREGRLSEHKSGVHGRLYELLRDGILLCDLMLKVAPLWVSRVNRKQPLIGFLQIENITTFVRACEGIGISHLFRTPDLYERKDPNAVIVSLNSLHQFIQRSSVNSSTPGNQNRGDLMKSASLPLTALRNPSPHRLLLPSTSPPSSPTLSSSQPHFNSASSSPSLSPQSNRLPSSPSRMNSHPSSNLKASTPTNKSPSTGRRPLSMQIPNYSTVLSCSANSCASSPTCIEPNKETKHVRHRSASPPPQLEHQKPHPPLTHTNSMYFSGPPPAPTVTSLEDDIKTKNEFKYSSELEKHITDWISGVMGKPDLFTGKNLASTLKSGVILCQLANVLLPDSVPPTKIYEGPIPFRQMENIGLYLQAVRRLGMTSSDMFNTPDLYEEKDIPLVINSLHTLAQMMARTKSYAGPIMKDTSHVRTLLSQALIEVDLDAHQSETLPSTLSSEDAELVSWINEKLSLKPSAKKVSNLGTDLRNGVALLILVEILSGTPSRMNVVENPRTLWQCMQNALFLIKFVSELNFSKITFCTPHDIVQGNTEKIKALLQYLREKYDLEYLFQSVLKDLGSGSNSGSALPTGTPAQQTTQISTKGLSAEVSISNTTLPTAIGTKITVVSPGHSNSPVASSQEHCETSRHQHTHNLPQEHTSPTKAVTGTHISATESTGVPVQTPLTSESSFGEQAQAPQRDTEQPVVLGTGTHESESHQHKHRHRSAKASPEDGTGSEEPTQPLAEVEHTHKHRHHKNNKAVELQQTSVEEHVSSVKMDEPPEREHKTKHKEDANPQAEERTETTVEGKSRGKTKPKDTSQSEPQTDAKVEEPRKKAASEPKSTPSSKSTNEKVTMTAQREESQTPTETESRSHSKRKSKLKPEGLPLDGSQEPNSTHLKDMTPTTVEMEANTSRDRKSVSPRGDHQSKTHKRHHKTEESDQTPSTPPSSDQTTHGNKHKEESPDIVPIPKPEVTPEDHHTPQEGSQPTSSTTQSPPVSVDKKLTPQEERVQKAQSVVRQRVAKELLSTEQCYVESLDILVDKLINPLLNNEKHGTPVLSASEFYQIFSNVNELLCHHHKFLSSLNKKMDTWADSTTTIGDIFLTEAEFFGQYGAYLRNFDISNVAVTYFMNTRPRFKEMILGFEKALQQTANPLNLDSFLIMPIQRLPRYMLLISDLLKYTGNWHPDHALLKKAKDKTGTVITAINTSIDQSLAENAHKLISLSASINGAEGMKSLIVPNRKFLKEGPVKVDVKREKSTSRFNILKKSNHYLFLFNDVLVLVDKKKKSPQSDEKPYTLITQCNAPFVLFDLEKSESFKLRVNSEGVLHWTLEFKTAAARTEWEEAIRKAAL